MHTLQKALPQLVHYTVKSDNEFKSQFVNSFSQHLRGINENFPSFNKVGLTVRSYYSEENDSYQDPILESIHFDIDESAFTNTDIAYSKSWLESTMDSGNLTIFPMSYMLTMLKDDKCVFLQPEMREVVLSINSMIYSVNSHVISALCNYADLNNFNIVFSATSPTPEIGEY